MTELLGMGMLCTGLIVSGYLVINQETHIFGIPMSDQPLSMAAVTVFFGMLDRRRRSAAEALGRDHRREQRHGGRESAVSDPGHPVAARRAAGAAAAAVAAQARSSSAT